MTKEEYTAFVLEGNKSMARFMGYTYHPYSPGDSSSVYGWVKGIRAFAAISVKVPSLKNKGHHWLCRTHKELRFRNEWSWLVPAWAKFWRDANSLLSNRSSDYNYEADKYFLKSFSDYFQASVSIDDLQGAFRVMVEAVKWYEQRAGT